MRPIPASPAAERMIDAVAEMARVRALRAAHRHRLPPCDECQEIEAADLAARERSTRAVRAAFSGARGDTQ